MRTETGSTLARGLGVKGGYAKVYCRGDGLTRVEAQEQRRRALTLQEAGWALRRFALPSERTLSGLRGLGYGSFTYDSGAHVALWDHAYRLLHQDGRIIYVGEPYWRDLGRRAAGEHLITQLRADGWHVEVRPEHALHYPGETVAVWVS